ncbi:Probable peroxidase 61 [Ancistrocladus abbreviatus]
MADPSMDSALVAQLRKVCPPKTPKGEHEALVYLNPDSGPKYELNNTYYSRILSHKAILEVDQSLFDGNDTMQITQEFAAGFEDLRKAFALSMARMGGINVLTGKQGEIRRNCSYTNKNNPFLK